MEQNGIDLSMAFFKERPVEVWGRGYEIRDGFADPTSAHLFINVEMPFDQPEDHCELD